MTDVTVYDDETKTKSLAMTGAQLATATPWDDEKKALIKRTIFEGLASDDEMALFGLQCQRMGLDPFSRQIYAWRDKGRGRVVFMTSIDGLRLIAERTQNYAGQVGPFVCGPGGEWVEMGLWPAGQKPFAAKVGVRHVRNPDHPTFGYARWDEFARPSLDTWQKMPVHMLCVVAERQALRKMFPNDLQGIELDVEQGVSINVSNPDVAEDFPIRETPKQIEAAVDTPTGIAPTQAPPPPPTKKKPPVVSKTVDAPPTNLEPKAETPAALRRSYDYYNYLAGLIADNQTDAKFTVDPEGDIGADKIDGTLAYTTRKLLEASVPFDTREQWGKRR
jgi:phage recombination protein Bet